MEEIPFTGEEPGVTSEPFGGSAGGRTTRSNPERARATSRDWLPIAASLGSIGPLEYRALAAWASERNDELDFRGRAHTRGTGHRLGAIQSPRQGFLTGTIDDKTTFEPTDFRNVVPRFTEENRKANVAFVEWLKTFARKNATPAQIALAWLLAPKPVGGNAQLSSWANPMRSASGPRM